MSANDRFQAMWSLLEMLRPEGYVLLIEEDQRMCWIAPKDEVELNSFTDRSKYGDWGSLIGKSSVEKLIQYRMIVPITDPGRRNRPCFEVGNHGRKALEEREQVSSNPRERLWIVVYQGEAYPYLGLEKPEPKSVALAYEIASVNDDTGFRVIGPFDLDALRTNSVLMNSVSSLASPDRLKGEV